MAILSTVLLAGLLAQTPVPPESAVPPTATPVVLERVFRVGQVSQYEVVGQLNGEQRFADPNGGLRIDTFLPFQQRLAYRFTSEVVSKKADGIAEVRYRRPTMTISAGPNEEGDMETSIEKLNLDLRIQLSPINEMLSVASWAAPTKPSTGGKAPAKWIYSMRPAQAMPGGGAPFVSEIIRLALFQGSLDSSVDLSPRLPYEEVKAGDTWKRTVGYSPQALPGKDGKSAVQRLDYVFTYLGAVTENGVKTDRVRADLKLDTDAAPFINQQLGLKPADSPIERYPLKLNASIEWRLDPITRATLRADAKSTGEFSIKIRNVERPLVEMKLNGTTTMRPIATAKAPPLPSRPRPRKR